MPLLELRERLFWKPHPDAHPVSVVENSHCKFKRSGTIEEMLYKKIKYFEKNVASLNFLAFLI